MKFIQFISRPGCRYFLSWLVLALITGGVIWNAVIHFDTNSGSTEPGSHRRDGNSGHALIDFGGQWLMGRMLREGHGRELYLRSRQRSVLEEAYPIDDEDPDEIERDSDKIMDWLMGDDAKEGDPPPVHWQFGLQNGVGGQLYPPINAFINYPIAYFSPRVGYRIGQALNLAFIFLVGLLAAKLSEGRVWWPVATVFFILFPGYAGTINLAQNAALTLAILMAGWLLMSRGYGGWGGFVWGLLAFKPVWGFSFFLSLVLMRRWKSAALMVVTGLSLALATIPFVGWHTWADWFNIGTYAAKLYETDRNWIFLSRDLLSIPRRWLPNFGDKALLNPSSVVVLTTALGWALVGLAAVVTVGVWFCRRRDAREKVTGVAPAFLFLSSWLLCFHFMYYDMLLASFPLFLLFTEPRKYLIPRFLAMRSIPSELLDESQRAYLEPSWTSPEPPESTTIVAIQSGQVGVLNSFYLTGVAILMLLPPVLYLVKAPNPYGQPWETYLLAVMWLACGVAWLRTPRRTEAVSLEPSKAQGDLVIA